MSAQLILSASAAGTSQTFVKAGGGAPGTVFMRLDAGAGALTSGDTANVEISHDGGNTWAALIKDSVAVQLKEGNNHETVYGPGMFRLNLTAASAALSAYWIGA